MGIVRSLPDVEVWLSDSSEAWRPLTDAEYKSVTRDWRAKFRPLIERGESTAVGYTALDAIDEHLPMPLVLFSGLEVPEVANLGGRCACGYQASGLERLDHRLLRRYELLVCAPDLSWTCLFSHETGTMFHEQLYGVLGGAA